MIAVVVIGRNEGERLGLALDSSDKRTLVVYVDSGSTDGSAALARSKGAHVVELSSTVPFTAARARNEGFQHAKKLAPNIDYIQFLDGDSELDPRWLEKAARFLETNPRVGLVTGRLREKHPERSLYNRLCDFEWDMPAGEVEACGGIAMVRASVFETFGGYRSDLIAGEEPEFCLRLRAAGLQVWHLGEEMARHDAAMMKFGQWWIRAMRGGYACAQSIGIHSASNNNRSARQLRSAWVWAFLIPFGAGLLAAWHASGMLILLLYPVQITRIAVRGDVVSSASWWHGAFLLLGKFPELVGQIKYLSHRCGWGRSQLFEYK